MTPFKKKSAPIFYAWKKYLCRLSNVYLKNQSAPKQMNVLLQKVLYIHKKYYWCQLRIKFTPEKNSFYSPLNLFP